MPRDRIKRKWEAKDVSPIGWCIASFIERFEFADEDKRDLARRCRAWKNTILIRADNPEQAYRRAFYWAKLGEGKGAGARWKNERGIHGRLIFEGFTMLLPVYDDIVDGCEVIWTDLRNRTVRSIKAMVSPKEELEVFCAYKKKPLAKRHLLKSRL